MKLSEVSVGQKVVVRSAMSRIGPVIGTVEYIRPEAMVPVLLSVELDCGRTILLAALPEDLDPVPHGEEGESLHAGL